MVTAGIDPSVTAAGYAVLVDGKAHLLGHAELRTADQVLAVVNAVVAFRPDVVAIESSFVGPNVATGMQLAELRGRLRQEVEILGIPVALVAPSTWRASTFKPPARCKRKQLKEMAVAYVADRYGLKVTNDEADALLIAEHVSGVLKSAP